MPQPKNPPQGWDDRDRELWSAICQLPRDARSLICELHKHDGAVPIGRMTELWYRKINKQWAIWVNGQFTPMITAATAESPGGAEVAPGDVYIEYNGWPAGSLSMMRDDGILAAGSEANYESFCTALQEAIKA